MATSLYAEAGGAVGHGVVQPAGEVDPVVGLPAVDGLGHRQRRRADQLGVFVHVGERGDVVGAQPVYTLGLLLNRLDELRGWRLASSPSGIVTGGTMVRFASSSSPKSRESRYANWTRTGARVPGPKS